MSMKIYEDFFWELRLYFLKQMYEGILGGHRPPYGLNLWIKRSIFDLKFGSLI